MPENGNEMLDRIRAHSMDLKMAHLACQGIAIVTVSIAQAGLPGRIALSGTVIPGYARYRCQYDSVRYPLLSHGMQYSPCV
jgi:hypothetical protein